MEPDDDGPVSVTLLDIKTGRTVVTPKDSYPFFWTGGNGSCDCNRQDYFGKDSGDHVPADWPIDHCIGCHRFIVVAVDGPMGWYEFWDFNRRYPRELIRRHLGDDVANRMPDGNSKVWFEVPDYLDQSDGKGMQS